MKSSDAVWFDFDELAQLAKSDLIEFARRRESLIQQLIRESGSPAMMSNFQLGVDLSRFDARPGIRSTERMTEMMLERCSCLQAHLDEIAELIDTETAVTPD